MKTFKTDNSEIIEIYQDYNDLKFIIAQMLAIRMYLLENEIIKEYVVEYETYIETAFTLFGEENYSLDAQIICMSAIFEYYHKEYETYSDLILKYFKCPDKSPEERRNFYSNSMRCFSLFDVKMMLDFKKLLKDMIKSRKKKIRKKFIFDGNKKANFIFNRNIKINFV